MEFDELSGKIILASGSERRRKLLAEAGYKFKVVVSQIDEATFPAEGVDCVEYVKSLALAKAADVAKQYPDSVVIGADTAVDFDGRIIGKARDARDAEEITRRIFSKPHKVITGVAIICRAQHLQIMEAETTVVYPKKLTDSQIAEHIASGIWRDKAGAYAIRECPASPKGSAVTSDPFVDHIEGSLTNVMGMPMELVERVLSFKC
ncbi:MAG: Maf family protein [Sedimentisphaerales bacterium]